MNIQKYRTYNFLIQIKVYHEKFTPVFIVICLY